MSIYTAVHGFAKATMPEPMWRLLRDAAAARRCYRTYFRRHVRGIFPTIRVTGERDNFTYELTDRCLCYLVETLSCALKKPGEEIEAYIREVTENPDLNALALSMTPNVKLKCPFGRRLGWYAVARVTKPQVTVETGVDRGHGSLILCAALLRNAAEGSPGRYFGTDTNPEAGELLVGEYATLGRILYGDSLESLKAMTGPIDLFINDSDHSADYEYREYETVAGKLSPRAIVLGDNAHCTDKLARFSRERGRHFLFAPEEPKDHWYIGAGLGISFPP
jgi:predicted O-methyltransferase YrrM